MNPLTPLIFLLTREGNDVPWQVMGDILSFEIKRFPMCGFQVCLEKVNKKRKIVLLLDYLESNFLCVLKPPHGSKLAMF